MGDQSGRSTEIEVEQVKRLSTAALSVLASISHTNLTRGDTFSVTVPRVHINALRDVFEEMFPGSITRCREIAAEEQRKR